MTNYLRAAVFTLTAIFCLSCASLAQRHERDMNHHLSAGVQGARAGATERQERGMTCDGNWSGRGDGQRHCEIKELPLAASGLVKVDGRQNGGVSVKGWDRNEILVRAKVEAQAPTESEAHALGAQVRIETAGGNIYAEAVQQMRAARDLSLHRLRSKRCVPILSTA